MKGMKYNLILENRAGDKLNYDNLSMKELIEKIKIEFDKIYGFIPKVSRNIVYNICNNRNCHDTILAHRCSIAKV